MFNLKFDSYHLISTKQWLIWTKKGSFNEKETFPSCCHFYMELANCHYVHILPVYKKEKYESFSLLLIVVIEMKKRRTKNYEITLIFLYWINIIIVLIIMTTYFVFSFFQIYWFFAWKTIFRLFIWTKRRCSSSINQLTGFQRTCWWFFLLVYFVFSIKSHHKD